MLDVDASWNSIGDAGCKALSNFLREIGQPVQSLKLLNNHIGSDGASALACLVNKVAVHELHLSHNRIGPDGMVRILKSLAVDASCFRVGTCRCSGSELVQTMEVAWGSGLAARAQKAAALLAKRGALGRVPGRWDVGVLVVEQAEHRLKEAMKRPGHGLGTDPHLYFALVQVELTLRGVAVKIART